MTQAAAPSENLTSSFSSVPLVQALHDVQQVAFQQGQHHLRLRVTKAAVVLDDLRAVRSEHQAKVEAALEGGSPRRSWP